MLVEACGNGTAVLLDLYNFEKCTPMIMVFAGGKATDRERARRADRQTDRRGDASVTAGQSGASTTWTAWLDELPEPCVEAAARLLSSHWKRSIAARIASLQRKKVWCAACRTCAPRAGMHLLHAHGALVCMPTYCLRFAFLESFLSATIACQHVLYTLGDYLFRPPA